jgi:hypothetical protein
MRRRDQEPSNNPERTPIVEDFSPYPSRPHAGYYADGGMTPREVEAQRPIEEYMSARRPGEDIDKYLLRRAQDTEAVEKLLTDGLATDHEDMIERDRQSRNLGKRGLRSIYDSVTKNSYK